MASKTKEPVRTRLPFAGEIPAAARQAILKRADINLSSSLTSRLKTATQEIRRLVQAQEALSFSAVRATHDAARESAVREIMSGAEPLAQFKSLDTLSREFATRREALVAAHSRVFVGCVDDLEEVGKAIQKAVSNLADSMEEQEREAAEAFLIPFAASPQLAITQSVLVLVKNRFDGIRELATTGAAHAGLSRHFPLGPSRRVDRVVTNFQG